MAHQDFQTSSEYQTALDQILAAARQRIRLYDATLNEGGFNGKERYAALRDFCLAGNGRRLEILLDDPVYLQHHCPRLMELLRNFSHIVEVRQTDRDSGPPAYGFVLADRSVWLRRIDKTAFPGQFDLDDAASAALLHQQFDHLWPRAVASVSATTLGLG